MCMWAWECAMLLRCRNSLYVDRSLVFTQVVNAFKVAVITIITALINHTCPPSAAFVVPENSNV